MRYFKYLYHFFTQKPVFQRIAPSKFPRRRL